MVATAATAAWYKLARDPGAGQQQQKLSGFADPGAHT